MPNKRYAKKPSLPAPPTGHRASGLGASIVEKTAAWPGLPGKEQSRSRSAGVKKVKNTAKSVGI